ncbi:MAG: Asp-tRNA(Asn)/Glu-tRNA(Gln) amidotransferase subunit GatB [Firmicutes bacterium]|nr:Asp-tRNA(Asn)/Glu-tRNA(Gln) amidotransferase subunit GatB [Bacillota bacterium]
MSATAARAAASAYELVIGLEVHIELRTRTKMFCACPVTFGAPPNTAVCPVCLGLPGALPRPNAEAVRYGIRLGLALGATIRLRGTFARKNYFYPDLPKGYQISQYDQPLVEGGAIDVPTADGGVRRVRVVRAHLEEDAGKLLHGEGEARVDLNRAGVPLVEVVSAPDLRTPQEARAYVAELRAIAEALGISDVRMEEGSLRVDANVSVRRRGEEAYGTRVEVKNLNSLRSLERALAHEGERQAALLEAGEAVAGETRGWDEVRGVTYALRRKEGEDDYRYFPDPDLPPLVLAPDAVERERAALPELPAERRRRYAQVGLRAEDAALLASRLGAARYFDAAVAAGGRPREVAAWVLGEGARIENEGGPALEAGGLPPHQLVRLLERLERGDIARTAAKALFERLVREGGDVDERIAAEGLAAVDDPAALAAAVERVLDANPRAVADVLGGKEKAIGALVGGVMRALGGRARAAAVEAEIRRQLDGRR